MLSKIIFAATLVCFGQFATAQDFPGSNPPATDEFTSSDSTSEFGFNSTDSVTLFDSNVQPASYDAETTSSDGQPAANAAQPLVTAQREIVNSVIQFAIAVPVAARICFLAIRYFFFRQLGLFENGPDGDRPFKLW